MAIRIVCIIFLLALALQNGFFPGEAWKFTLVNNCSTTVWPASATFPINFSLQQAESKALDTGSKTNNGWLWGRTHCKNSSTGVFSCKTGDCGTGNIDCSGVNVSPSNLNATATMFYFFKALDEKYLYFMSLINGYNLPILVVPQWDGCSSTGCMLDVSSMCPTELKLGNSCRGPCEVFHTGEYCCSARRDKCHPSNYSRIFKNACPLASTYPVDDTGTTFLCSGTIFTITFCPSTSAYNSAFSIAPQSTVKNGSHPPTGSSEKRRKQHLRTTLLVSVPTSITILILSLFGIGIFMYKRMRTTERYNAEIDEIKTVESLQFDLNTIRRATRNFSIHNKLGEGGFGEVYKGKLESGQEVAIKRLSNTSGQGVGEFKTEIVLVAKLQHKHLVKLLGFCVASNEKILVYEYHPNSSLDRFLFDPERKAFLDWQTRMKIMVSVARGILYLHEDSRLKVIHRDLKASNILLDSDMNAKISDFGLARLFGVDQTQGDTNRIVGTYGYMAPEYAITGHYSVKSDVFSFGVIVLEIVSGQKNRFFGAIQLEEALLHRAWRLWKDGNPLDMLDVALGNNFLAEEVLKCIHIGLLCIQEDPSERPTMRAIVAAFDGQAINLPMPKSPQFFGCVFNIEDRSRSDEDTSPYIYTGTKTITDLHPRA